VAFLKTLAFICTNSHIFCMIIKAIVHPAEEGGFWAEVPALPGCLTQGETQEEIRENLLEAIEVWFEAGEADTDVKESQIMELAI
jgi:predicted RNase H-like HicB family nuclease